MNRSRLALLATYCGVLVAPLFSQSLLAQNADSSENQSASFIEEVMVTAQRREQSLQDVSVAVTAISGDQLRIEGIRNINQLQNTAPNLEVEPAFGGGAAQFRIRGVGFQDYATNNSPTVGIYVNEVAFPVPVMTQGLVYDIERVEVLRGPQGTLYGRNTTGGAINFITKKPTEAFDAGVYAEYGSYNEYLLEGHVSGPVSDTVRGRISASTQQGGAWQHNRDTGESIGDMDRGGLRSMLQFDPNDRTRLLFDVHYTWDKSENKGLYLLTDLPTRGGFGPTIPADTNHSKTGWGISPIFANDIGVGLDAKPGKDNSGWGTSLTATFGFDNSELNSITSYESLDRAEFGDWDASYSSEADTFFGSDVSVFSQELRLSSIGEGALHWTGGIYYSKQKLNEKFYSDFLDIFATYARVDYDQEVESIAIFGQVEYAVSDKFNLIGGMRYEQEDRKLKGFGTAFGGAQALPPTDVKTDMDPVTGKVALEFTPSEDTMIYGSISRGVKSGGFTTYNTGNESSIQPFEPEVLIAYEAGFKLDVNENLRVNGAIFYYDYSDQQVLTAVWTENGPVGRFANAPKSHIYGAELELYWQPTRNLGFVQTLGYKKGQYDKFFDLSLPLSFAAGEAVYIDRDGESLPFPNLSYSGSANYNWDIGNFNMLAETNYSYHDHYTSWLGKLYDVDSYWLVNASINLSRNDGPWTIGVWLRNVFDEEYDITRNFFTSADIAQPGRGRTVGLRFSASFQ